MITKACDCCTDDALSKHQNGHVCESVSNMLLLLRPVTIATLRSIQSHTSFISYKSHFHVRCESETSLIEIYTFFNQRTNT